MQKEVLPVVERLYAHDWALTRRLLKKASELDLLRLEIPPVVRRPRTRPDQRVVRRRADRHQPVVRRIARRAHVDRHAAARVLRHRRAEGALSAAARERRADRRVRAHRAAVRIGRARGAHHRDAHAGRPSLRAQRPEDVDHQRRLRRSVHHLRQGRRRQVHRVPRRARDGRRQRTRRDQAGPRRLVDDGADARQRQGAGRERARHDRPGPQGRVQRAELRAREARRAQHVGRQAWRSTTPSSTRRSAGSSGRRSPSSA